MEHNDAQHRPDISYQTITNVVKINWNYDIEQNWGSDQIYNEQYMYKSYNNISASDAIPVYTPTPCPTPTPEQETIIYVPDLLTDIGVFGIPNPSMGAFSNNVGEAIDNFAIGTNVSVSGKASFYYPNITLTFSAEATIKSPNSTTAVTIGLDTESQFKLISLAANNNSSITAKEGSFGAKVQGMSIDTDGISFSTTTEVDGCKIECIIQYSILGQCSVTYSTSTDSEIYGLKTSMKISTNRYGLLDKKLVPYTVQVPVYEKAYGTKYSFNLDSIPTVAVVTAFASAWVTGFVFVAKNASTLASDVANGFSSIIIMPPSVLDQYSSDSNGEDTDGTQLV
jgi:hypothetical protein